MSPDTENKVKAAREMVAALCKRERDWLMSIPAQATDPDIVIADGLCAAIGDIERLEACRADLLAACQGIIRLADMGFEESMREPEESGNFAAYEAVKRAIAKATEPVPVTPSIVARSER